jgi:hypothetical protein
MKTHPVWFQPHEDAFIKKHWQTLCINEIARRLNRSRFGVRKRMFYLGVMVPKDIRKERMTNNRFKPGHTPANKGHKMSEYISHEKILHIQKTQFKKGLVPWNSVGVKDGDIRQRYDSKTKRPYLFIRIKLGKWECYHRYLWRTHHGAIPRNKIVVFKDGNSLNCQLSNLALITTAENAIRNAIHKYPEEIKKVIKLNNKLKNTLHEKQNNRSK